MAGSERRPGDERRPGSERLPGDELVPAAALVMDRETLLAAAPDQVWPWVLQLGKGRGGWYLAAVLERLVPRGHRALRHIDPAHQRVAVGERVPDYGRSGWFEARIVDPPRALVWWSERGRASPSPGRWCSNRPPGRPPGCESGCESTVTSADASPP